MKLEPIAADAECAHRGDSALPPEIRDLRRFIRRNITSSGRIRVGGRRHVVRLENLSEQGCQIWLPLRTGLAKGSSVSLHIETLGPFEATVRWHHEGWAGIEFDLPVYPPVLAHIHDKFDRGGRPG